MFVTFLFSPHQSCDSPHQNDDNGNVAELKLDGCLLVDIFSGQVTAWNDARILDLNPGVPLPEGDITVVHRRYGSSSTSGTTQYLQKLGENPDCPNTWPATMNGGTSVGSTVGTDGVWFEGDVAAQGSSGVLAAIRSES